MIKIGLIILTLSTLLSLLALLFIRGWLIERMRAELEGIKEDIKCERMERVKWQEAFEKKHQSPWQVHTKGKTA